MHEREKRNSVILEKFLELKREKKEFGNFGRLDEIQEGFHVKKLTIGQKV